MLMCTNLRFHLLVQVSIRNAEENRQVMGMCKSFECWIGLTDKYKETNPYNHRFDAESRKGWEWYDGSIAFYDSCSSGTECSGGKWNYHAWSEMEPNNAHSGGGEDCVQMWSRDGDYGSWNDERCTGKLLQSVCEMPPGCPAGYYQTGHFSDTVAGKRASCNICPQGYYKATDVPFTAANAVENQCKGCSAGKCSTKCVKNIVHT